MVFVVGVACVAYVFVLGDQVTPEGKVKEAVKKALKKHNVWYFLPVSRGLGTHGIPDFICCYEGRFVAIECKAAGGKPTTLQEVQLEKIADAKGMTFVIDPSNIDTVDIWLTINKGKFL